MYSFKNIISFFLKLTIFLTNYLPSRISRQPLSRSPSFRIHTDLPSFLPLPEATSLLILINKYWVKNIRNFFIKPLVKLGDNVIKLTPPWLSPTSKIGSLLLKLKFVSFADLDGFSSANFVYLSIFKSYTKTFSKVAVAKTSKFFNCLKHKINKKYLLRNMEPKEHQQRMSPNQRTLWVREFSSPKFWQSNPRLRRWKFWGGRCSIWLCRLPTSAPARKNAIFHGFPSLYLICLLVLPWVSSGAFVDLALLSPHDEDIGLKLIEVEAEPTCQTNEGCFLVSVF